MLEASFAQGVSSFKDHYQGKRPKNRPPLSDFNIRIDGREWKGTHGDIMWTLDKIALEMSRHGFVQHYGVDESTRSHGDRKAHKVTRKAPNRNTYERKEHEFDMNRHEFIATAIERSGAVEYILRELVQLRGEQIFAKMAHLMSEASIKHMKS